ncbi:MAG: TM2 domain-containing protein [Flavobacteriales bacterium]|nr:TM2 domain-containing protein [Flavobacteriales bacterium]
MMGHSAVAWRALVLGLTLFCGLQVRAGGPFVPVGSIPAVDSVHVTVENQRIVGSGLALLLGPFGAHRIYLGTTPKVAVIYGLTFGGFGVLPLIDLGHLLFSKDLEPYRNNDRVIMWGRPKERITPR